jgi:hypothetical protein
VLLDSFHTSESAELLEEMKHQKEQEQQRAAAYVLSRFQFCSRASFLSISYGWRSPCGSWQAVNQWQPIDQPPQHTSRYPRLTARRIRRKYLWVSEITGEVRTGRDDCHMWTVTADENSWPVFVHSETGSLRTFGSNIPELSNVCC